MLDQLILVHILDELQALQKIVVEEKFVLIELYLLQRVHF